MNVPVKIFTCAAAVIIAAASFFYAGAAEASCAAPESTAPFGISVTAAWKAEHVNDGDIPGCLLTAQTSAGQKITAYTPYEFICALKPDEKITVMPSYACCDTGLQGDFACGVKPRVPLAVVNQTPLTVTPAAHDARAIADLAARSLSGKLREASAISKLQEYLGDPAYSETVRKQLPQLETAMDSNTLQDPYTRGLVAALLLAGYQDSPKRTGWRIMQFQGGIDYALTPVQKNIAQELLEQPDTAERFMPVLVDRVRRAGDDDRAFLLSVASRTPASKLHINELRDALGSDIDAAIDAGGDTHAPPRNDADAARRGAEQKAVGEANRVRSARRDLFLPLLSKIACSGETGPVTVGGVYKSTLDCPTAP